MRLLFRLFILIALVFTLASVASAQQIDWRFGVQLTPPAGPGYGMGIGVSSAASNDYDNLDIYNVNKYVTPVNMMIYHTAADGWAGPEGFYYSDVRQPITGEMTWNNIYYWWEPGCTGTTSPLYLVPNTGALPPSNYKFTLYLDQVPQGITYNGPWSWNLSPTKTTIIPEGTFTPYASTTGLDSYKFHLTVSAVPEPSSLMALSCGLVGLLAVGKRRLS